MGKDQRFNNAPRPNFRRSICRHLKVPDSPLGSMQESSGISSSRESSLSAVSSSSLQITMCLSLDGNRAANRLTSVVRDDPSDVRVKL